MTKTDSHSTIGNLICLKSVDGVPLFTRNFNDSQQVLRKKIFFTNLIALILATFSNYRHS